MKFWAAASLTVRIILWVILGILLLPTGIILALYSPWGQNLMREHLVDKLNTIPGVEVQLDRLRLTYPLNLALDNVRLIDKGDTLIAAHAIRADVELWPLLKGHVGVNNLDLTRARFQLGNADSLLQMVITADTLSIAPATVKISPLDINLERGRIAGALVDMIIRPDTSTVKPPATVTTPLNIHVGQLDLSDFTYRMNLMPTIDSLGVTVGQGTLDKGEIDLIKQTVAIKSFTGKRLAAAYIAPDSAEILTTPVVPVDTAKTEPWTVTVDSIHFTNSKGLYTTRGIVPEPGLDFAYIEGYDMDLLVRNFYNQETTIRLPIELSATERCGVTLRASGTFAMDSTAMYFKDFEAHTQGTNLYADGMLGVGDLTTDPHLPFALKANGNAAVPDLRLMFPAFKAYLAPIADDTPVDINLNVSGCLADLSIDKANLRINHCATIDARGKIANITDYTKIDGNLAIKGNIIDVNSIVKAVAAGAPFDIPPMTLDGKVAMNRGDIKADLKATALGGELALDGHFNGNSQGYALDLTANQFPVNAFVKDMGVGKATAHLDIKGQGFDPFAPSTAIDGKFDIISVYYQGYDYQGISLALQLDSCKADIQAIAKNQDMDATITAHANLSGPNYTWTADIDGREIDLYAMKMSETPASVSCAVEGEGSVSASFNEINANLDVRSVDFESETAAYTLSDIALKFEANDSLTQATITNRDLVANASAPYCLDSLSARFGHVGELITHQIEVRQIQPDTLQKVLPHFSLYVSAGANNLINDILSPHQMSLRRLDLRADNDTAIDVKGRAINLVTSSVRIDTIGLRINQLGDKMQMKARMNNNPGTWDDFAHVDLNCMLDANKAALRIMQRNIQDETGFDFGTFAMLSDSVVTARIFPITPTIGYKRWTVNLDNYLAYNFPLQKIGANLTMQSDKSSLTILADDTANPDSIGVNDVTLQIKDIHLADWISINPFAPPISGDLSADMHVRWAGGADIDGDGTVTLADFTYAKQRVGTFESHLDVATNNAGMIRAKGDLMVDSIQTMTIDGALNDSTATSPLNLDLKVIKFPLAIANPFMPPGTASMTGTLSGSMDVSGDMNQPLLNGNLQFDSASVEVAITATSYAISPVEIPVKDNLVTFNDFGISGTNENPLTLNGTVDLSSFISPKFDLALKADNMMVVNSQQAAAGAEIFGKAYISTNAKVRGNMNFMSVNADLSILSGTNVTYVLSDVMAGTTTQTYTDMVKFVNFSDSLQVAKADTISDSSMLMAIDANLVIQSGTTFTVDLSSLSSASRDKVQVQPTANLTYTQTPASDGRLTGRIIISDGYARYTIPVISQEKYFTIDAGSYIAFNGDILNPTLHINATDAVKSNVTEDNNSRMVNFDILVAITGTLDTMDVQFDLTTNDDLAVANELQTMSPDQRANQAMNLLLYNMYTGPGASTSNALSANPLYSFLESQANNWLASNVKFVDLSFGIDQYNQTTDGTTSSAMNYSYQMSKSLFNDRFKIVVGGNYNTEPTADETIAENLISDISFVYYLNDRRTMLIKLFRHTGYESILEGEITETGVGFVYKRKINYLVQILPRFMRPKKYRHIEQ
ncbi:MAG: translocation/assembly module TamB [Bacteroidales bacterium]|nr:translocation/assembly module TamB [Bacteroidales bacterium]